MAGKKPPSTGQTGFDFGSPQKSAPPAELFERPVEDAHVPPAVPPAPVAASAVADEPKVFSVGDLVRLAGRTLEAKFSNLWVEGEVSNLSMPRSGHIYFTLKDHEAQLPAVMFRTDAQRLKFQPEDGQVLRARGRLSIFQSQGKFQLYVDALEPIGLGAQQLAFEQLKAKLAAEGLFDAARKRRLPAWPRTVGLVTSPTGAAVRDIIRVAHRRGRVRLLLSPCQVQGDLAPYEIVAALELLGRRDDVDVIIVGRGGGSSEDLAAFNDERVARAIAACRVPVVSAVGHEVDFSIADFVADVRAPTPSAAAELVVPMFADAALQCEELTARLGRSLLRRLGEARQRFDHLGDRATAAVHRALAAQRQQIAGAERRLNARHPRAQVRAMRAAFAALDERLTAARPTRRIAGHRNELQSLRDRAGQALIRHLHRRKQSFSQLAGRLQALSPLAVLERGYAVATTPAGHVVTSVHEAKRGEALTVRVRDGEIRCTVDETEERGE